MNILSPNRKIDLSYIILIYGDSKFNYIIQFSNHSILFTILYKLYLIIYLEILLRIMVNGWVKMTDTMNYNKLFMKEKKGINFSKPIHK